MKEVIKNTWQGKFAFSLFLFLTAWWVYLQIVIPQDTSTHRLFGAVYGIMALWGAIWGIIISRKWGGITSVMGKAIIMFSLGLLAQEFGQATLSFFHYAFGLEGLYPSLGDVGFFGSIPLYIFGIILLAKASGVRIKLQSFASKIQAILIPLIMLGVAYYFFLQGYKFDWSNPIRVFLDFGYPLGDAIYISFAILTYLLSRGILGGVMKNKILFILFALAMQFIADFTFLYQTYQGIWHVGEINDYMYFLAYFLMTLALLQLNAQAVNKHLDK